MIDNQSRVEQNSAALVFEGRNQLGRLERVRENLAFAVDDHIDQRKLWGVDFRLRRRDLDVLDQLLGRKTVLPLRQAIVKSRCDGLLFSALKVAGQIGLTGSVAVELPESIPVGLGLEIPKQAVIPIAAGVSILTNKLEAGVRKSNYYRVLDAARPVIEKLYSEYGLNFWDYTDVDRRDSVKDAIRAIALGEVTGFSEFSLATLTLLNAVILSQVDPQLIRGIDPKIATGAYVGGEAAVLAYLRYSSRLSGVLHNLFDVLGDKVANAIQADAFFGTHLSDRIQKDKASQSSRNEELAKHTRRNVVFDTVASWSPLLVQAAGAGEGLVFALLGQLSDQLLAGTEGSRDLSEAQIGLTKLREAFETITKLDISLVPPKALLKHCIDFKSRSGRDETTQIEVADLPTNPQVKARFSPFDVHFRGDVSPKIIMDVPLDLQTGFYDISRPVGQPYSVFLNALALRLRLNEHGLSFINIGTKDQVDWREIHDLPPEEIREHIIYIPAENSKFRVSAISMFTDDIRDFLPVIDTSDNNPDKNKFYVAGLLERYKKKESITPVEQEAVEQAIDYFIGTKNTQEVQAVKLSRQARIIRDQLLHYLTPEAARAILRKHLETEDYKVEQEFINQVRTKTKTTKKINLLFSKKELDAIEKTASFAELNGSVRAKLRILAALNKARTTKEKSGAKVVLLEAMDPIDDAYTERLLVWISKWIRENDAVVIIATGEDRNKSTIKKVAPDLHRGSFTSVGPYVSLVGKEGV